MRKKELSAVITFHNTTEAIAAEQACQTAGIGGRLIPIPGEISAGCGMAWKCSLDEEKAVIVRLKEQNIEYENIWHLIV